ncbi:uncharacterized protein LOC129595201 [Paramacrobiotus metropolitanus]|uniref:uncharacterized protein LOC129595201 n=1 Tax=Paramacrobiotus metropolitanus TaxID=2943436 RepID=UPI002445B7CC|nr:uncharacterized protein LOC129595201 [Paramacrobiotus metropolitanus]
MKKPILAGMHFIAAVQLFRCSSANDEAQMDPFEFSVPFPRFSTEPMTQDQCALQFTANCGYFTDNSINNCTLDQGLNIMCKPEVNAKELLQLATALSKPPIKAVAISLEDGAYISFANLSPVRKQTVIFGLNNCITPRSTKKLAQLRMPNLLHFIVAQCRNLDVRRADFWQSSKLRLIEFWNTTLQFLEVDTFTDLPALRLLSLESAFHEMGVFDDRVRQYLARLHCGCEYEWFRDWWQVNGLLRQAAEGEVYRTTDGAWENGVFVKESVFLPVDCATNPFHTGFNTMDNSQPIFSANEERYPEKWNPGCKNSSGDPEKFPVMGTVKGTIEECHLRFSLGCLPLNAAVYGCQSWYDGVAGVDVGCETPEGMAEHARLTAAGSTKFYSRPIDIWISGDAASHLTAVDLQSIRNQVVSFGIFGCVSVRSTYMLYEFDFFNALEHILQDCTELDVRRKDYQRSKKLRSIVYTNVTIRTLERDAFSDLPDLRIVALEKGIQKHRDAQFRWVPTPVFEQSHLDYLFRLHCGCDFAWFRRWWKENTALLRDHVQTFEVYAFQFSWANSEMFREDLFLPIDCAVGIPNGSASVNFNQTEYSINDTEC